MKLFMNFFSRAFLNFLGKPRFSKFEWREDDWGIWMKRKPFWHFPHPSLIHLLHLVTQIRRHWHDYFLFAYKHILSHLLSLFIFHRRLNISPVRKFPESSLSLLRGRDATVLNELMCGCRHWICVRLLSPFCSSSFPFRLGKHLFLRNINIVLISG